MPMVVYDIDYAIEKVPEYYSDWLKCFDVLQHRDIDKDMFDILCNGKCSDAAQSTVFFEEQLIKTINIMMKRYIAAFNKEMQLYGAYNEYESIHRAFQRLAGKLKHCMFFAKLNFLSEDFKEELQSSIMSEAGRFWNLALNTLYVQNLEQYSLALEDEIYQIKRIKLSNSLRLL
jgi:hypothetical protein